MELDFGLLDRFEALLPKIERLSNIDYPINQWIIKETNSQLAYLTHGFFRYYGKFPSTLVSQIIRQFPIPDGGILIDNFVGSGTSLVEASRRGIRSVGIDINPISTITSKVKTKLYNTEKLLRDKKIFIETFNNRSINDIDVPVPEHKLIDKWFFVETIGDLIRIKQILFNLRNEIEIDFFFTAFLAIIRRVSKAYDGEVRPHINSNKKTRIPLDAYIKKVDEMIAASSEFAQLYPHSIEANTYLIDNRIPYDNTIPEGNYWLALSHPPYLNCFDYIPVFKLELVWLEGFNFLWGSENLDDISKKELKSWPAKDNVISSYYDGLRTGYKNIFELQPSGGILAVVIGDCTIKGKLEKVHIKLMDIIEEIGYSVIELNYRTTHYTTGKYSYQHRANYHGDDEKRDAIIIFKKP